KNSALLGAPLNWDFAFLRERRVLPGVGTKSVRVRRVNGIVLDGRLNEPAWEKAKFEEMSEISMGAQKNAARFKVAYDGDGLFEGVVCEFDLLKPLEEVKPVGKDGAAWAQECLEIMLDPYGERERHYQFIINPAPNSTYDARYAFIEDPLHPLHGKRDSSWHGRWQYATVIDKEQKRWTAEVSIPFSTLNVKPPTAGTSWTMNVGRAEYPGGYKNGPVYSLWSPNLETRSFHDRATFGDVTFK
ncbi:MAG: sugar-binding protein, partial [Planctomycetota bacterium]|nr:sugar-binding protein [Planctomycetota bacterium]